MEIYIPLTGKYTTSQHISQQQNVVPQLINLWLTAEFNVFDCVIAKDRH